GLSCQWHGPVAKCGRDKWGGLYFLYPLLITAALLFRMLGVWMSTLGTDLSRKERLFCMIAYLPKATVQAAIGAIPLAMGLGSGETILAVAVLAIILTAPLGALGIELSYKRLLQKQQS
ncbi:cation:proton antiporter domain-containing protein, partial [Escherichia coli]|uniref:cation:proton antiporter domain-containing protein n=2 Tax=Escherichia coli TaxID=562 RepID=UPI001BC866B4